MIPEKPIANSPARFIGFTKKQYKNKDTAEMEDFMRITLDLHLLDAVHSGLLDLPLGSKLNVYITVDNEPL